MARSAKDVDATWIGKEERIALSFVTRYPLARYIECGKDSVAPTVPRGTSISVVYVGFGGINRSLLFASDVTERFFTEENGRLVFLPVRRYVFGASGIDRDEMFRYDAAQASLQARSEDYFPLPEKPSEVVFSQTEIGSDAFWKELEAVVFFEWNTLCFVVFASGSEQADAEMAERLVARTSREATERVKVFLKGDRDVPGATTFGKASEEEEDRAIAERLTRVARKKHAGYAVERTEEETERWNALSLSRRRSNLYAAACLRSKLLLAGFDVARSDDEREDASEIFRQRYQEGDAIVFRADGAVDYGDCAFRRGTIRNRFAEHEHDRWNAYTLRSGYLPTTIDEAIAGDREQWERERKHPNLTTYEGLLAYKKLLSEARGCPEKDADVIRFDYQLMDDATRLLQVCGYKIVRR